MSRSPSGFHWPEPRSGTTGIPPFSISVMNFIARCRGSWVNETILSRGIGGSPPFSRYW